MEPTRKTGWILSALTGALLGALGAWTILSTMRAPAGPSPGASHAREADWTHSLEALTSEVSELRRMLLDGALRPVRELPREPASALTSEALLDRLDALEQKIVRFGSPQAVGEGTVDRLRPVQLGEVQRTAAMMQSDREGAQHALRLLTVAEAVERFGFPDTVEAAHGQPYDMYWWYQDVDSTGTRYAALELYFVNGLVLYGEARLPN